MAEVDKLLGLRCPHCGGPLPETKEELVKCKYCGTVVRIEEASKYLEHLKGFVVEWIRTALPLGVSALYSPSVDPLARHNILVQNILPSLNAEFSKVQYDAFECFSTPLIAPPFVKSSFLKRPIDTKSLFSYDAKVTSVQPLAVTDDDTKIVQKIGGLARALAHVLIALDLMDKTDVRPYKTIAENFTVAAEALGPAFENQSNRLVALSDIYLSIDAFLSRKVEDSRKRANQARDVLEKTISKSMFDINLSVCVPAMEQELEIAKTVLLIINLVESNLEVEPLEIVSKVENLFRTISMATSKITAQNWKHKLENPGRYREIMGWLCLIFDAKKGRTQIRITPGSGRVLFPFWAAEINYTFSTGAFLMRKGKYVKDTALVAATFPLHSDFTHSTCEVVTDIFERRPDGALLKSIMGSENSISIGGHITKLTSMASLKTAPNYWIVPPLTTVSEAKQLIHEYLQQTSNKLGGKLQVASSEISDIIFVPAELTPGSINFGETLGWSSPKRVGDLQLINSVII